MPDNFDDVRKLAVAQPDGPVMGDPPILYRGGPVMHAVTLHAVYWNGGTTALPSTYMDGFSQFLADVATSAVSTGNVLGVARQYGDADGPAAEEVTVGTSVDDIDPFPASACAVTAAEPVCLTNSQIAGELTALMSANNWAAGLTQSYIMLLPPGVRVCDGAGCSTDTVNGFCGYHTATTYDTSSATVYTVIPYPGDSTCTLPGGPGDPILEAADDIEMHELIETATDPLPPTAWTDSAGEEVADDCAWLFGPTEDEPDGGAFNQVLGGNDYLIQEAWSDQQATCAQQALPGLQATVAASAARAEVGQAVTYTASVADAGGTAASYAWSDSSELGAWTAITSASGPTTQIAFAQPGTYVVWATITDPAGYAVTAVTRTVVADAPTAELAVESQGHGAPARPQTGSPVDFDGSGSTSPNGDIASYLWKFGDGSTGEGRLVTHSYGAPGVYAATLAVTDSAGYTASATQTIAVEAAPTVRVVLPASVRRQAEFDAQAVGHSPYGRFVRYVWSFGDGHVLTTTTAVARHGYRDSGIYAVSVMAIDASGQFATGSAPIRIIARHSRVARWR